jgi:hypothetical protein
MRLGRELQLCGANTSSRRCHRRRISQHCIVRLHQSSSGMLRQTVYWTFTSESSHGVLRQIKTMVYCTQLSICCSSNVAVSTLVYNTRVGDGVDLTERSQNAATFCTNLCALCILCSTERRLQPCSIRRPPNDASRSRFRLRRVHRFCG